MFRSHEIVAAARKQASQQGWSGRKLALQAGLHPNTLRRLDDPKWDPSGSTLDSLSRALEEIQNKGA